jgi:peptidoglycan/LPS O-acetylase OafA/YrhL/uncharacterized membrane-anchored protein
VSPNRVAGDPTRGLGNLNVSYSKLADFGAIRTFGRGYGRSDSELSARRFVTLTGMRGAAALWVVTFHAYPLVAMLLNWPERARVPVVRDGFLAVDLFFILSGFVLSYGHAERVQTSVRGAYVSFLAGRVRRIFPLHWVCLGVVVLLVKSAPDHWWGPGPFSSNSLITSALLVQTWVPSTAQAWNHPAWSLSAEWLAYLVFPLVALALGFVHNRVLAFIGAILAILMLEVFLLSIGSASLDHVGAGGIVRCLCEFVAGALIWKALWAEDGAVPANGDAWVALGAVILGLAVSLPMAQVVAPFGFLALVIGCVRPSRVGGWLFGNRVLTGLGEISFSFYLIHAPVLASVALAADRFRLQDAELPAKLTLVTAIPLLVLGASILLWRFVEIPSRQFLQPSSPYGESLQWKSEPQASTKLVFWLTMVVAMTFSETAADFLSGTMALGYGLSCALLVTIVISVLVARIEVPRFSHLSEWALILCLSMAGTALSDCLDMSVGLGDFKASIILALTLLAVRRVWRSMPTTSLGRFISVSKAESMYTSLTVLLVGALCTSFADLMSEQFGLQHRDGFVPIIAGLTCIAAAGVWTRLPRNLVFWAAFVLIRPLGVTFGDALTKSHVQGGLQIGAGHASLILMAAMIVLIPIAGQHFFGLLRQSQGNSPAQAST